MTAMDYHDMAKEIRGLVPLLIHAKAAADLRSLADQYERLAHHLEVTHGAFASPPPEHRRHVS